MKLCKLQCDRCGNEFEEGEDHKLMEIKFKEKLESGYFYANFEYDGTDQDLCKFCRKSFKEWWND